MWLISEDCTELADALPLLVADEETDGDVLKTETVHDDVADCARYGLKSMLGTQSRPREVERVEMLEKIRAEGMEGEGPMTPEQAERVANRQYMADLKFQEETRKKQAKMFRRSRFQRQK